MNLKLVLLVLVRHIPGIRVESFLLQEYRSLFLDYCLLKQGTVIYPIKERYYFEKLIILLYDHAEGK